MTEEMTTLVKQYERLIYKIASKFSPKYPIEDLFQVGVIGLINAKKNYKSNQGTKFTTYAYQYVLGEMLDFIKKDRTIKVSKDSLKIYKLYEQAKETLAQRKKQIPTFSEICEFLELFLDNSGKNNYNVSSRYGPESILDRAGCHRREGKQCLKFASRRTSLWRALCVVLSVAVPRKA